MTLPPTALFALRFIALLCALSFVMMFTTGCREGMIVIQNIELTTYATLLVICTIILVGLVVWIAYSKATSLYLLLPLTLFSVLEFYLMVSTVDAIIMAEVLRR